jgi:cell shape-determining protein MreC
MTCQNLQNKLLNITVLFIWYLLQIVGEFKKNVTRQTWQALFHFGEYLFQSTRHFGECLKNMVSHTKKKTNYTELRLLSCHRD